LREAVPSESVTPHHEGHSGVTLLDLVLMMSGSWALPSAVEASMGHETVWRIPSVLVAAISCLFWGWYCGRLVRVIYRRVFANTPVLTNRRTKTVGLAAYVWVLVLSVALQYSLYRAIRFLLTFVHPEA